MVLSLCSLCQQAGPKLCCILLLLFLQVTVGDDEDAPLLKVSDPANNAINLIPTVPVHMLLFQTRQIGASLLCMAANMDPTSPAACCEHILVVSSRISTQLVME